MTNDLSRKSFNLIEQQWIPVAGEKQSKSLMEVFTSPPQRLSGNAVDKIVMFRFLLSIVHASSKIPDETAWRALTPEKLAENARNYLSENKQFFDLYDPERPFLQFPQLKKFSSDEKIDENKTDKRSLWTLKVNYSENQSILSSWQIRHKLQDDEIARFILRASCASLASAVFEKEILLSEHSGFEKRKYGAPGTLLGSPLNGYLHAYLLGNNLWESLRLNLLTEDEISGIGAYPAGLGNPFWEEMPKSEDDDRAKSYMQSYLGRIFPIDKCILITNGKVIKTDGIPYISGIDISDPALTIFENKKGEKTALSAKVSVRPWRELASLLIFLKSKEKSSPFFLYFGLKHLRKISLDTIRFWVGGVEISYSNGGQQIRKSNDYMESEFLFPLNQLKSQFLKNYSDFMLILDGYCASLSQAVKNYFIQLCKNKRQEDDKGKQKCPPLAENQSKLAETAFWARMESRGQFIIDLAAADPQNEKDNTDEKKIWWKIVMDLYDEFCPNDTARQMSAWVEANPKFNRRKGKNKNGK